MIRKDLVKNVTELRKDPVSLFRYAKRKDKPVYIFNRTEPLGVVISWEDFEKLAAKAHLREEEEAIEAVAVYEKEKAKGKLKTMKNLDELFE